MKTNDIITHFMTFTDVNTGKVRPLYVIQAMDEKVLMYKITSKYDEMPEKIKQRYYPIKDWQKAGLNKPSYIDTYSGSVWIAKSELTPIIGRMSQNDILQFSAFIASTNLNY